jgi:hypothetical protein
MISVLTHMHIKPPQMVGHPRLLDLGCEEMQKLLPLGSWLSRCSLE